MFFIITFKDVDLGYNNSVVVESIDMTINQCTIYGLVGKNGSGKTTFMRATLKFINPLKGFISLGEFDKNKISYLPEERGLNLNLTVYYHIRYIAELKGMNPKQINSDIDRWLSLFNLEEKKFEKIKKLSKGNKQKILIIITFINNPNLIILDEPFDGLDIINIDILKNILLEYKNTYKSTIIISSHNLEIIQSICDEFIIIKNKKIVQINDNNLNSKYIKDLIIGDDFS